MTKKKTEYITAVALRDDKTGEEFKAGDTVKDSDFPASVIANWLDIGVLTPKGAGDGRNR